MEHSQIDAFLADKYSLEELESGVRYKKYLSELPKWEKLERTRAMVIGALSLTSLTPMGKCYYVIRDGEFAGKRCIIGSVLHLIGVKDKEMAHCVQNFGSEGYDTVIRLRKAASDAGLDTDLLYRVQRSYDDGKFPVSNPGEFDWFHY